MWPLAAPLAPTQLGREVRPHLPQSTHVHLTVLCIK